MTTATTEQLCHSAIPVLTGKDRNVTYILDTSEAMAAILGKMKNLIIQSLLTKASLRNSLFNIITFSYKSTSLSEYMIPCAPDTVFQALSWIHTLRTSPGNDLTTALITALSDPACQSVHLVINSLPEDPAKCLNALSACTTRPVHTFYISKKKDLDRDILDFVKCLASATKGSCFKVSLNSNSPDEQVSLLHSSEQNMDRGQVSTSQCYKPIPAVCMSPYWYSTGNPFCVTPCFLRDISSGAEFFPGCRVLAKKEEDGFYYLGTIVHQLQDRKGLFMVTFDKCVTKDDNIMEMASSQFTCQPDMVNIIQAHKHSLVPGDTVLAPWEPQMSRYGPGRVVFGMEVRDPLMGGEGNGLEVLFWNGIKQHVPRNLAVWIPASHHGQIIRDLQSNVFQTGCSSHSLCSHFNLSPSGVQSVYCVNNMNHCLLTPSLKYLCPIKSCPFSNQCLSIDNKLKEQEIKPDQKKELEMKADVSSSDSSEAEEEVANEKFNSTQLNLVSRSVNTEISYLKKAHAEPMSRPSWRYWRRESPTPHHRKPGHIVKPLNLGDSSTGKNSDSGYSSSGILTKNHSSVFEMVPHSISRDITIREVFAWSVQKSLYKSSNSPLDYAEKRKETVI